MVRVKHRYLLVQILYPSPATPSAKNTKPAPLDTLAIHGPTADTINAGLLSRILREKIEDLFGDYGAGAVGPSLQIKYLSNATSTFIVRCARAVVRLVWAACTFIGALPVGDRAGGVRDGGQGVRPKAEREVVMQVVRVSGTIRKCEEEAIRRARVLMGRVKGLEAMRDAGITMNSKGSGGIGDEEMQDEAEDDEDDAIMADDDEDEEEEDDAE